MIADRISRDLSFLGEMELSGKALLLMLMLLLTSSSLCRLNVDPIFALTLEHLDTNVGGGIITNTTWTLSGSPYTVTADVFVLVGVFLTVEPGITVKFDNGTSIIVDGTLIIQGDSAHETSFTSSAPSPAVSDWGSIRTRTGGRIVGVEWATVEYSAGGIEFPADSSYIVSDCVFRANGVGISGSNVNITRCNFEKNTNAVNALNVQVMNSEFFNNTNAIAGSGACAAQNIKVWNNSGNGIQITGPVTNCLVHDNGGYGVDADSIVDCLIYNNAGSGARTSGSIVNCSVFNNGGDGITGSSVFNCSVYSNGGNGVDGGYGGSIANCSIHDNGGNGASPGYGGILTNSSIFGNKDYGVSLKGNLMSQCRAYNNLAGGVIVFAGCSYTHAPPPDSYVNETEIYNNQVGILISSDTGGTYCFMAPLHVSNCTIHNNLQGGIVTEETLNLGSAHISLTIEHTRMDSNGQFGIRFTPIMFDNSMGANTTLIASTIIEEISDCTITNQTVGALGRFGSVTGSNITGNSQIGLDIFSAPEISGNNIYGNGIYNIKIHLPFGQDLNATMNWWGTTNDTEIQASIYDYYDDYNLSRVLFEPTLTSPIPEFPSFLTLPMFMITTFSVLIFYKKIMRERECQARACRQFGYCRSDDEITRSLAVNSLP